MSNARSIRDFIPAATPTESKTSDEDPTFVGHLLILPLTNGEQASVDPDEITAISKHRKEPDVTVLRQRGDSFTYFVDRPYEVVMRWVEDAFED